MPDRFVYVTYIRTTPEKLWEALTRPEFTRQYWFDAVPETDWRVGSSWRMLQGNGRVPISGEILEIERPRRLVVSWRGEFSDEVRAEGHSRCAFEIERIGNDVKLTVTQEIARDHSKLIESVSGGWPMVLSNLKSLLETGEVLGILGCQPEAAHA